LAYDLFYAVEFFVHEDPLLFVENLERKLWCKNDASIIELSSVLNF
jgi:hypothetical protein